MNLWLTAVEITVILLKSIFHDLLSRRKLWLIGITDILSHNRYVCMYKTRHGYSYITQRSCKTDRVWMEQCRQCCVLHSSSICCCRLQIHSYPLSPIGLCVFVLSCLNLVDTLPFFPEAGRWQLTNMKYRMDRGGFFLYQNLSIEPSDFPIILKFPLSRRFFLLISSYSSLLPFLLRAFHCLIIYGKISIHSSFKKS